MAFNMRRNRKMANSQGNNVKRINPSNDPDIDIVHISK